MALESKIENIPEGMKKLGFELVEDRGTKVLFMPCLEAPLYFPNHKSVPGEGYFTQLDYFEGDNAVNLRTADGEQCLLRVDGDSLRYSHSFEGKNKSASFTYEPERAIRDAIGMVESRESPKFSTSFKDGKLNINDSNGNFVYAENVDMPPGIKSKILLGKYIRLNDAMNVGFRMSGGFFDNQSNNALIIPRISERNEVYFDNAIGGATEGSFSRLDGALFRLMKGVYNEEFRRKCGDVNLMGRTIKACGSSRVGDYNLVSASGASSVIIHQDGSISPWSGWYNDASTDKVDSAEGTFIVAEHIQKDKQKLWKCQVDFEKGKYDAKALD